MDGNLSMDFKNNPGALNDSNAAGFGQNKYNP
jgi:hypothetical protein